MREREIGRERERSRASKRASERAREREREREREKASVRARVSEQASERERERTRARERECERKRACYPLPVTVYTGGIWAPRQFFCYIFTKKRAMGPVPKGFWVGSRSHTRVCHERRRAGADAGTPVLWGAHSNDKGGSAPRRLCCFLEGPYSESRGGSAAGGLLRFAAARCR
jgi:hypothetical protein